MAKVIWCLGVHASGSTWIYNAALEAAKVMFPEAGATGSFLGHKALPAFLSNQNPIHVVKTHGLNAENEATLVDLASAILLSIRDPRDAVSSLMLYHEHAFSQALQEVELAVQTCERMRADHRTILLRYESGFVEDPQTIAKIAAALGGNLSLQDSDCIFNGLRRESVNKLIASLDTQQTTQVAGNDVYDAKTQWHRYHANRSGEMGKWRRVLTPDQIASIEWRFERWMALSDYDASRDFDWLNQLMRSGVDLLTNKEQR